MYTSDIPANVLNLTLVVPCFNEEQRLSIEPFLELAGSFPLRIIFVNDGSTDRTQELLERFCDLSQLFSVLHQTRNQGKGEAVRAGICEALKSSEAKFVGYWDADLATPLDAILELLSEFEAESTDIVIGARVKLLGRNVRRSRARHVLGRIFASCASLWLRAPVYDTQCGAKLFRVNDKVQQVFSQPFVSAWLFDIEILKRYLAVGKMDSIVEVPLQTWRDVAGSKVKFSTYFRALSDFVRIVYRYRGQ